MGPPRSLCGGAGLAQASQPQHRAHRKAGMQSSFSQVLSLPSQCHSHAPGCALKWFFFGIIFLLISLTCCLCFECFYASFSAFLLILFFFFCLSVGAPKGCTTAQAGSPATQTSGSIDGHSRTPNTDYSAEGTPS